MTYFVIICITKKFQVNLEVSEALITYVTNRRKARVVKSVQSALSDLLTTSATHGTFSRPSTKRGLILIGLELNTNARESFELSDHIH